MAFGKSKNTPAGQRRSQKQSGSDGPSRFQGGKTWFALAILTALAVVGLVLWILSSVASTTTYYVLNQDVPARTQVTEDMLTPVVTATGGEPRNAIDINAIASKPLYTKYALNQGDTLNLSNSGALVPVREGIPENFVVASFTAPPEYAVAGRVERGSYIDIIARDDDSGSSKYVLQNVLVVEVNSDLAAAGGEEEAPAEGEEGSAADTSAARSGVPTVYTVALSPQDAAKLPLIADSLIYVVLSPAQNLDGTVEDLDVTVNKGDIFLPGAVGNSGEGTTPDFASDATEEGEAVAEVPAEEAPAEDAAPADENTEGGNGEG